MTYRTSVKKPLGLSCSNTQENDLMVTGLGGVTIAYLRADFAGDDAEAARLTQAYGANALLAGVTAALRSSIAEQDRMTYLEQLAEALLAGPATTGASAFVRGL